MGRSLPISKPGARQRHPWERPRTGCDTMQVQVIDGAGGAVTEMARNIRYGTVRSVLPYLLQDDYSRELVPQETSVATLENDYLLATVLLDFGGRLWSLQDKVGGRELLYNNDRIQFGNLGLRNAWFPGGVEWNLGTTGHTALTCSPVHAASLEFLDGAPGLRIYEWERMRDLVYQLDFRLGPRSRRLVVDIKVTNPNAHAVPVYWWSNIALASSPGIRVVVPSRTAFEFTYAQRLHRVPVPGSGAADLTYPHAARRTADYFFELDPGRLPWIAAVDPAGVGLLQVSTRRLRGRKLFTWGTSPGGRRWQEFLTGSTQSYFEIQAGLTRPSSSMFRSVQGRAGRGPRSTDRSRFLWRRCTGSGSTRSSAWSRRLPRQRSSLCSASAQGLTMPVKVSGCTPVRDGEHSSRFGVRWRGSSPRRSSIACSPVPASGRTRSPGSPCWKRAPCHLERRAPMSLERRGPASWNGRRTRPRRCCTGGSFGGVPAVGRPRSRPGRRRARSSRAPGSGCATSRPRAGLALGSLAHRPPDDSRTGGRALHLRLPAAWRSCRNVAEYR